MNNLKSSPVTSVSENHEDNQNALKTAWIMLVASIILGVVCIFLTWQLAAWQMGVLAGLVVIYSVVASIGIRYIQNRQINAGLWIMIICLYLEFPAAAMLVADIGFTLAIINVILSFVVARNLPASQSRLAIYISLVAAALTLIPDLINLTNRLNVPLLQTVITGLAALVILAVVYFFFPQTWGTSNLRTKLVIILLLAALVPLAIIAYLSDANQSTTLKNDANAKLLSAADVVVTRIDSFELDNLNVVRAEGRAPAIVDYVSLPAAQRRGSPEESRMNAFMLSMSRQSPVYLNSVAIIDAKGTTLADTDPSAIGSDRSDRYYFQQVLATKLPYASTLEYDKVSGNASLYFAAPIRNKNGVLIGVLRKRFDAAILQDFLVSSTGLAGQSSFGVLLDENYVRLAHGTNRDIIHKSVVPMDPATVADLQSKRFMPPGSVDQLSTNIPDFKVGLDNYEKNPFFVADLDSQGDPEEVAVKKSTTQQWLVVFAQKEGIFLQPIYAQRVTNVLVALVIALLVSVFGFFISQTISGPVSRLTSVAEAIASGNITIQAQVETGDEIGTLAGTFNRMTQQLRDFIASLEERVAARTRNLELAAEVGRTVSQVRALDVMLTEAAELIRKQFDLYYVQVYLINPSQTTLTLQSGTGNVGKQLLERRHSLPLDANSINGRAAIEKKSVVIANTADSPTFKPNPLLPDTRSEMAVPLLVGDRVVGVLDMQSKVGGSLSTDILPAFEALAGQLAIAIQNANFLAETQAAREEVERQARRLSRQNWNEFLDAVHKPERIGFEFAGNQVVPTSEETPAAADALSAPIAVTGETLGNLVVEVAGASPIARTDELVNTVARQVAQQIEALRLLESAERYRVEAEAATRRNTLEGWRTFVEGKKGGSLNYIYDLNQVKSQADQSAESPGLSLPLKVRDEEIGNLSVLGATSTDQDTLEIVTVAAERLAAHIENLRLSEQTLEKAQREQILRQVTSAVRASTDPEVILRTAVRELGAIFGRKTMIRVKTDTKPEPTASNDGNEASPTADPAPSEA